MKKLIVAFDGPKGSGKSYMANYLKNHGFVIRSFAAPLKNALTEIFGAGHYFRSPELKENVHPSTTQTARVLMTSAGDFFRSLNPDCFTNKMIGDIGLSSSPYICVDDLRYDNEAEALKFAAKEYGYKLFIVRIMVSEKIDPVHSSENGIGISYVTHTIFNNKTESAEEMLKFVIDEINHF